MQDGQRTCCVVQKSKVTKEVSFSPGHRSWGLWVLTPWKYVGGVRICFDHVTFFQSKLLSHNSASFTSWRMKDLRQKWKMELIFPGAWKQFNGLTCLTPPPYLNILRQIHATAFSTCKFTAFWTSRMFVVCISNMRSASVSFLCLCLWLGSV